MTAGALKTVGILHPGEMGAVVGEVLAGHDLRVLGALDGRSAGTRTRTERAGFADVGSLRRLVEEADVVLSILVPSAALETAQAVAREIRAAGSETLYADCNAVAAGTSRRMGEVIAEAGGRFVDASIIGPPPRQPGKTRFYASGEYAEEFARLGEHGLDVRPLGPEIGQASAIKTCYASVTKGLTALAAIQLAAAHAQGLDAVLMEELRTSQPALLAFMERSVGGMPPKAHRWIAEMEEHARAFEALGLPGQMMQGAAELFRFAANTPIAREAAPGQRFDLAEAAAALAEALGEESRR